MLSVVWLAVAALGCAGLVGITHLVSERARLQNAADVIALAFVSRDSSVAERLASTIGVKIHGVTWNETEVTVEVTGSLGWATATAAGGQRTRP